MNPRFVRYDLPDLLLLEALGTTVGKTVGVAESVEDDRNDVGDDGMKGNSKHNR